jgi:hypothetical protein
MHRNQQSVVVSHKEYLGEVRSSTTFKVQQSFPLNPGMGATFPWLSGLANQFQEYRFKGMVFHYIPSSGSAIASTNNALGTVMLQTTYRSTDALPVSKVEMLNEYWSSEDVPSEAFCHPVECDPAENPFNIQYVRSVDVPSGDSQLLYDLGTTHLAVSGQQANGIVLGDLWVTYEVELKKPVVASNSVGTPSLRATFTGVTLASWYTTIGVNTGNLAATISGSSIVFPKASVGTWMIETIFNAGSQFTSGVAITNPTLSGCVLAPLDGFSSLPIGWNVGASSLTTNVTYSVAVTISDPAVQAVVQMPLPTLVGSIFNTVLIISQL